jgi:hypothetical protein
MLDPTLMRRSVCFVLLLAVTLVGTSLAQEPYKPPTDPPTSTTEVFGEIPTNLTGVWLMVANGRLTNGQFRNTVELYTVAANGSGLDFDLLIRELPTRIKEAVDKSNKDLTLWTPEPADIQEIGKSIDDLEAGDPMRYMRHTVKVIAPDKAGEGARPQLQDQASKGLFSLEIEHAYRPQPVQGQNAQLMADKAFYTVEKIEPTVLEGQHIRTILAAGFVPIPVTTQGAFRMYRLRDSAVSGDGAARGGGIGQFLSELFRGCN